MKTREFIRMMERNGWVLDKGMGKGSHRRYRKDGRSVIVPYHAKELGKGLEMKLREATGLLLPQ